MAGVIFYLMKRRIDHISCFTCTGEGKDIDKGVLITRIYVRRRNGDAYTFSAKTINEALSKSYDSLRRFLTDRNNKLYLEYHNKVLVKFNDMSSVTMSHFYLDIKCFT